MLARGQPGSLSDLSTKQEQNELSFRHSVIGRKYDDHFLPLRGLIIRKLAESDRLLELDFQFLDLLRLS
jgi:hypothetical protein